MDYNQLTEQEKMYAIFSFLLTKAADLFPDWYQKYHQSKVQHQHDFILEAIGAGMCLAPDAVDPDSVSLDSVDTRIRILQQQEPDRARECGMPQGTAPDRKARIKAMLNTMVIQGRLRRGKCANTYRINKERDNGQTHHP